MDLLGSHEDLPSRISASQAVRVNPICMSTMPWFQEPPSALTMGVSINWQGSYFGLSFRTALLFGVCMRARDCWKLTCKELENYQHYHFEVYLRYLI